MDEITSAGREPAGDRLPGGDPSEPVSDSPENLENEAALRTRATLLQKLSPKAIAITLLILLAVIPSLLTLFLG